MESSEPIRPAQRVILARSSVFDVDQVWPILGAYVELVWSEPLGVTALALARRLAHLIETRPVTAGAITLDALAVPLQVPIGKVLAGLRRLHHHRFIVFDEQARVIHVSGFAPSVPDALAARLSPYTARILAGFAHRAVSMMFDGFTSR